MRIGIDFDNTIASYEQIFYEIAQDANTNIKLSNIGVSYKTQLKTALSKRNNGDKEWQRIQGYVYGLGMPAAHIMYGFFDFILNCKINNWVVYIVSHKSQYGHFDKSFTQLRLAALDWMKNNNFFNDDDPLISKNNIFFLDTQDLKIKKIQELNLDLFIDDLLEVFQNPLFPRKTLKFLLTRETKKCTNDVQVFSSWNDISKYFFNKIEFNDEIIIFEWVCKKSVQKIERVNGGGNSKVFKVTCNDAVYAMKIYPEKQGGDWRNRQQTEERACNFLSSQKIQAPKIIASDTRFNVSVFEWIDGEKINIPTGEDLKRALKFLSDINIKKNQAKNYIKEATEACFSPKQLIEQIEERLQRLLSMANQDLNRYLNENFFHIYEIAMKSMFLGISKTEIDLQLDEQFRTLSPSDFGFHNAIRSNKYEVSFIDFEYFGFDDPAKLICDFLWHPGMNLNEKMKKEWVCGTLKIYNNDQRLIRRVKFLWAMYGVRWILIILKSVKEMNFQTKNMQPNHKLDYINIELIAQIKKAQKIMIQIKANPLGCPYV